MYWSSCTPFRVIKSCNYVDLFLNFCYLMYWCYLLWRCDLMWLMWFDAVIWMKGRSPTALWIVLQWFRISPWMTRKQNSLLNDIVTTMTKMSKKLTKWWRFKNFYYDRIFLLWVITQEILKIRIRNILIYFFKYHTRCAPSPNFIWVPSLLLCMYRYKKRPPVWLARKHITVLNIVDMKGRATMLWRNVM